ncbi:rhodanese-related sulfurtransferase [Pantanalinema rosaneae CENA516]|uniref:oxygen-dependent tRNA uridine(34) hydroxylase TrhO n=1 Tax=Pantanalinema rosaneae TaxID=1620701 RepID=UPI003D6DD999
MALVVITFYKFVILSELSERQSVLLKFCSQHQIKGTILLAMEGINGTIAGSRQSIDAVLALLQSDPLLSDLEVKASSAVTMPFDRMKVKIKREIVTLGQPEANPAEQVGTYVDPQNWNQIISDPEVVVIDTRNDYEVNIGSFKGAENPQTATFRQFPEYVQTHLDPTQHKKVAMFCTGGIRCEKASAYLLKQGFQEVYHLKGGILKYLETVPPEESLWQGECFVFDQRVAVQHGLALGTHEMCRSCGHPISDQDKRSPEYQAGISCPYCIEELTEAKRARQAERQRQFAQLQQPTEA